MKQAHFFRKIPTLEELKEHTLAEEQAGGRGKAYWIFKTIELSEQEFKEFSEALLSDRDFIAETTDQAIVTTDDVWYCLLVKPKGGREGILVHSTGYNYARYAAIYRERDNDISIK
ncbi:hypothetical protein JCM39194_10690 [Desulfotomaculum varum]